MLTTFYTLTFSSFDQVHRERIVMSTSNAIIYYAKNLIMAVTSLTGSSHLK